MNADSMQAYDGKKRAEVDSQRFEQERKRRQEEKVRLQQKNKHIEQRDEEEARKLAGKLGNNTGENLGFNLGTGAMLKALQSIQPFAAVTHTQSVMTYAQHAQALAKQQETSLAMLQTATSSNEKIFAYMSGQNAFSARVTATAKTPVPKLNPVGWDVEETVEYLRAEGFELLSIEPVDIEEMPKERPLKQRGFLNLVNPLKGEAAKERSSRGHKSY
jgi:hypothetical protein